ncbi:MAG: PAS domain-containing protein [Chloroflexi bacterium]|nr:PAS domain-containing protein [Chloroflexota bacterium]
MRFAAFQDWLNAVPLTDPIERRLSPLIQLTLIGLAVSAAATVIMGLVTSGLRALSPAALAPTVLFITAMLAGLALLRQGRFRASLWVIVGATMIAQARNTLSADLTTAGAILMAYAIPIALAGLLLSRRALLLVLAISTVIVYFSAQSDFPNTNLPVAYTLFFLIIYGLLSFLLALFNRAFRLELTASISRGEELAQLNERLHVTLTSIGDAVITTDERGHVALMNAVAEQLTGWTQAEAAGRPLVEVFHILNEYTRQPVESPVDKVMREGTVVGLANHTILIAKDGREVPIDDSGAPIRDSRGQIAGVVLVFRDITERRAVEQETERLYRAEQESRAATERTAQRLARLQDITAALSGALTYQQVADVVAEQGFAVLGAQYGTVSLLTEDGLAVQPVSTRGFTPETLAAFQRLPLSQPTPLTDSIRTGQSVWISSLEEYQRRYPDLATTVQPLTGTQALACIPMRYDNHVIGGLGITFTEPHRFSEDERSFLLALAHQCGQALERARLYEAELQARQQAEKSREQVTRILESITDAHYAINRNWEFVYVNAEAERALGRTRNSLLGKNIWEEFPPAVDTELYHAYHRAMAEGVTVHLDYYFYPPLETWFDIRAYPSKDGLFVYFQNVSERRRAEEALRRSEQTAWQQVAEISAIYDNAPVGLAVFDPQLRFQRVNKYLAEINGLPPEDHVGHTLRELLPTIADQLEPLGQQVIKTGQPILNVEVTGEMAFRSGVERTLIEHWVPLKDQTGRVTGINIVAEDVTERKQMEAAEREQRALAESLRDITIAINSTLDLNDVLDRILESVRRVVPHDAGVVLLVEDGIATVQRTRGLEFNPVLKAETENAEMPVMQTAALREMVEHGRPLIIPDVRQYPGWLRSSVTDEPVLQSFIGAPVYLRYELIGFINLFCRQADGFTEAHAERLRLFAEAIATALQNARLYQQAQELAAYEERQRLARDLHDAVSQTLFSATTLAEALPRLWQRNPQRTMEQLDQIVLLNRAAMAEMRTLLLELRPEAILNTRLNRLLTQLVEVVQGRKRMAAELVIEGDDEERLPPGVHLAIYRIAQESLNNVVKHSQATRFTVKVNRRPGYIRLCIQDNGRGFDAAQLSGGLGLDTMRERAEAIGATLDVSSTPGEGTEINVIWEGEPDLEPASGE